MRTIIDPQTVLRDLHKNGYVSTNPMNWGVVAVRFRTQPVVWLDCEHSRPTWTRAPEGAPITETEALKHMGAQFTKTAHRLFHANRGWKRADVVYDDTGDTFEFARPEGSDIGLRIQDFYCS